MSPPFQKESIIFQPAISLRGIRLFFDSKKSPTGPTERTPQPEYLIALATSLGVRW